MMLGLYELAIKIIAYALTVRGLNRELLSPKSAAVLIVVVTTLITTIDNFIITRTLHSLLSVQGIATLLLQMSLAYFVFCKIDDSDEQYSQIIFWAAAGWFGIFMLIPFIVQRIFS